MTFAAAAVMVSKSLTAAPFPVVEFRQQMEPVKRTMINRFLTKKKKNTTDKTTEQIK